MTYVNRIFDPAYYNEIDPYAADWLENLIRLGAIAPGIVDRRSIVDLRADDLRGFRQCHFFAGIGVWSYSLRRAGISDDTAVWTGSCPCQPFSAAGKGTGVDDERHLWPAWFSLIRAKRPKLIYGEQVASKDGLGWLDLVLADLEGEDYSVWAVDTCSAGSGAPHIRQRLRFRADDLRSSTGGMGNALCDGQQRSRLLGRSCDSKAQEDWEVSGTFDDGRGMQLADSNIDGCQTRREIRSVCQEPNFEHGNAVEQLADDLVQQRPNRQRGIGSVDEAGGWLEGAAASSGLHGTGGMVDSDGRNASAEWQQCCGEQRQQQEDGGAVERLADDERIERREVCILGLQQVRGEEGSRPAAELARGCGDHGQRRPGPTNGFWRDADWLFCRDDKWRPVESGTFPLVDGASFHLGSGSAFAGKSRQGMLKGYGNAIDAEATVDFLVAAFESLDHLASRRLDDLLV